MKPPRTYASPETFKQALEQRLKTSSKSGADFARRRQLLVFDRFLARVVATVGEAATLKGGLVLELRLERARTTKDVDLRMVGSPDDLLATLQAAGRTMAREDGLRWTTLDDVTAAAKAFLDPVRAGGASFAGRSCLRRRAHVRSERTPVAVRGHGRRTCTRCSPGARRTP